jgi:tetrahydromethanopterin S-methyltransferase subunit A
LSECYSRLHFEAIQDILWTDIKQKKANTEHLVITIQAERERERENQLAINIQTASLVSRRKIKRTQYRNIGNTEVRMFSIEFSSGRLYSQFEHSSHTSLQKKITNTNALFNMETSKWLP